jgi:PIN like domain
MRVMLDECMTLRASRILIAALAIHKPPIEAHFLVDYLRTQGALDVDWAEQLQAEGDWCVITCDYRTPRGQKARAKGPPLHLILPHRKITGFFLGGKIATFSGFEKARAVIYTFPELWQKAQIAEPGSRFKVTRTGTGYKLSDWPQISSLPASL